jgi:hypothetical protein
MASNAASTPFFVWLKYRFPDVAIGGFGMVSPQGEGKFPEQREWQKYEQTGWICEVPTPGWTGGFGSGLISLDRMGSDRSVCL